MQEIPQTDIATAADLVHAGALLLDVREPDEWLASHAPVALHIPLSEFNERHTEVPRDQPIVAICRGGGRSAVVTEALLGAGYDIVNVIGGMHAWEASGYPVVTDDGSPGTVI